MFLELISEKPTLFLNYGRGNSCYFSSNAYDVTKLHNTIKTHGPYTLKFKNYDKTRIDGTVRWVTPTLSNEALVEAMNIFRQKEPSVNIMPHTSNRIFTVYTDKPKTITLHHIKLQRQIQIIIPPVNPTPQSPVLDTSESTFMCSPTTDQDAIEPQLATNTVAITNQISTPQK